MEAKLFSEDLSLAQANHYSLSNMRSHTAYMTKMTFEYLAKQHPHLRFVHMYPGVVETPAYHDSGFPLAFRLAWTVLGPVIRRIIGTSPEDCGQRTLFLSNSQYTSRDSGDKSTCRGSDGDVGSGAYTVGASNDATIDKVDWNRLRNDGFEATVWSHTTKVFQDIEEKGKFQP